MSQELLLKTQQINALMANKNINYIETKNKIENAVDGVNMSSDITHSYLLEEPAQVLTWVDQNSPRP